LLTYKNTMERKIEIDEKEQAMIVKGLEKLEVDADKLSQSAIRMDIGKAAKEADLFKLGIVKLKHKVMGKETLI